MSSVLCIYAGPPRESSYSRAVAQSFLESYRSSHGKDRITELDLFQSDLPEFDARAAEAKYKIMHGRPHSEQERETWKRVEKWIREFTSADKHVFAVPMWNFGVPYRLKQYLDVIVQPGYTFSFSPQEGYRGLVTGKPALVILARGGEYGESSAMDFQKPYMETILQFMGFTDIRTVCVEPTMAGGPDTANRKRLEAIEKARRMAASF